MIKANELRVGNIVEIKNDQRQYYYSITGHDIDTIESYEDDFEGDAYPIPLTPELLEKAGFKTNGPLWYHPETMLIEIYNRARLEGNCHFVAGRMEKDYFLAVSEKITSLHQLQNIYYALIGKELAVSELTAR